MPVEILGLNDVPNAGEIIMATESEKEARNIADTFIAEGKKKLLDDTKHKVSLDALFEQIQAGNMKELDLIIKADVQGSVGGAGALLSKCITKSEIVCYEDLGAEAIRKLQVKDFPVIVVIDSEGNNLYETAIKKYCTLE